MPDSVEIPAPVIATILSALSIIDMRAAIPPPCWDASIHVTRSKGIPAMRYLHTMVRITDVDRSLDFYCNKLGMTEVRRVDSEAGRYTLIFLAAPKDKESGKARRAPLLELT